MDLLLILTYAAVCIVVFKVFKIPLNKWTVPTAVLGGIILIGGLIFTMNYNHPYTEISREYFVTTPIVPAISGIVINVPVAPNERQTKGDVLFQIDPIPYANKVKTMAAQLVVATDDRGRAQELMDAGVGRQRDLDVAIAQVEALEAQVADAEYDLERTTVIAPGNGYVTQVTLRPGMMAVAMPLRPVMIFVHEEEHYHVAWFRQNSMLRLKEGDEAEVAFDGIPGTVFTGVVDLILPVIAEGQVQPTGNLMNVGVNDPAGRIPVHIKITDERFAAHREMVAGGAFAQTAVYTEHFHHVAIMRKILLRMSAWMNYLFPFH
ncbi:MAG: HlyD family secretion protein [bacterium]|nr:HlyD family secretion protein [Gammaproteobacteria bacterium]HIL96234.1 HlyD family secretion protein [Pseudomonadales bacterium]